MIVNNGVQINRTIFRSFKHIKSPFMKKLAPWCILLFLLLPGCHKDSDPVDKPVESALYFPPVGSDAWETILPDDLGWNTAALNDLFSTLETNGTRAFIVLQDGKIVIEEYWGKNIMNTADFDRNSNWYWASAGKTLIAFLIGIAQEDGLLSIYDRTSDYLGTGWTSMSSEKEELITIRHQLTMTTGLDYTVADTYCTEPECLQYKTDAGEQWFYHNAPYTLLKDVITSAAGIDHQDYTDLKLEAPTGMNGTWIYDGQNNVYWSKPRDMARFGLLILNKGSWEETLLMSDEQYFTEMTTTSQSLNPAYGYLWWLNGKQKIVYPGLPISIKAQLSPDAPEDLIVGAGKNGQFVDVVPSLNMVVVRMGEAPGDVAVPIEFHNEMWLKLNPVIGR